MGQSVHLMLYAESDDAGYQAASEALAELRRVEARLSLFDDASDLSELNRHAGRVPMRVGADLLAVLEACRCYHRVTGGAFNAAVEPLMRAWGFHLPRTTEPSVAEIAEAEAAVQGAIVRITGETVSLPAAPTRLDLGGIGVGYGLDRAIAVLRRQGIGRALLDISGDCYALGSPPGEPGWRVGIADSAHPGRLIDKVSLTNLALATSANTVSVIRYGDHLRGHVMDPASGYPAQGRAQATVVTTTGLAADALSKALLVSGVPARGVLRYWLA
jgi:thiamine biosynthesis lipoprotein